MPEDVKKTEETKKAAAQGEKPTNCSKCNKRLKRKSCYYRNGAYFCSKRCWKQASQPKKESKT